MARPGCLTLLLLLLLLWLRMAVTLRCPTRGQQDLASAVRAASVVLTGKVEAVDAASDHVSVRVKRVVRGPAHSGGLITLGAASHCGGGADTNTLRVGQTAIFLAAQDLRLLLPPVTITMDNLNALTDGAFYAALAAMMVRWRRGRGAAVALVSLAVVGAVSALAAVFLTYGCPSSCPSLLAPVCGTDDVTYRNLCQLQRKACVHRDRTKMAHQGACGDGDVGVLDEDPCVTLRCPAAVSRCVVSVEGAACECEAGPCPQDVTPAPVCGSDGRTYGSECELSQAACRTASTTKLKIRLHGPCDPCLGVSCRWPAVCRLDAERRPRCECGGDPPCRPEVAPVCASDGNTYGSECALRLHACRLKTTHLRILYRGNCSSGSNPCSGLECEQRLGAYAECHVDASGVGRCRCPREDACEDVYRPVCASDGRTYHSDCHLRPHACLQGLGLRHHGVCADSCDDVTCDFHGVCKVDSEGFAACSCDVPCPEVPSSQGVCGSDGKSHGSLCQLQRASCLGKKNISVVHQGPCRGGAEDAPCRDVRCDLLATCEVSREDGLPRCVCRFRCGVQETSLPAVCGSDGRSYPTLCHLQAEACRRRKHQLRPIPPTNSTNCADVGKPSRCQSSHYGCCKDGKTPAKGPGFKGCHKKCFCNKLGTWKGRCDAEGVCVCRKGVVGARCDRCDAGFWGLSLLGRRKGCQRCQCSPLGSLRQDCDQMTGRCSCLPGVQGRRCHLCSAPDKVLGPQGCASSGEPGGTDRPSTLDQDGLPQSKSTRHLHLQRYHLIHRPGHEDLATPHPWPTPSAVGDACSYDAQCAAAVTLSVCLQGVCRCRGNLVASADKQLCREYNSPGFDGNAVMRLPCLQAYHKLRLELELVVLSGEGVVLYNQHREDGSGDFVALTILNGHVQFRYNLGSGVVVLTSREKLSVGRRHRVSLRRYQRDGSLRVDDQDDVTGQSQGFLRALDLQQDLYLGRLPPGASSRVVENAGTNRGLVGCVLSLQVNQQSVALHQGSKQVLEARGVRQCRIGLPDCASGSDCDEGHRTTGTVEDPCRKHEPCVVGSVCSTLTRSGGFKCTRTRSEEGPPTTVRLNGSSPLELPHLEGVTRALALDVLFQASKPDGVVLFSGQRHGGDLVALLLVRGKLHFRFDLGSGPALLRSPDAVVTGRWHRARASRVDREGTLQLDEGWIVHGFSAPPLEELNVDLPLYLGGIPGDLKTPLVSPGLLMPGLVGAVQSLSINGRQVDLLSSSSCNATRCRAADEGAAVIFDGKSSLKIDLKTRNSSSSASWDDQNHQDEDHRGLPAWRDVSFIFRTSDAGAQLLRLSDGVRVELVHGFLQLAVDGSGVVRTKVRVNDGQWHRVSLQRRPRRLQLHVDAASTLTLPTDKRSRWLWPRLWLGGEGFAGCISKVVLGKGGDDVVDVAALASRQWGNNKQHQACHHNDVH